MIDMEDFPAMFLTTGGEPSHNSGRDSGLESPGMSIEVIMFKQEKWDFLITWRFPLMGVPPVIIHF